MQSKLAVNACGELTVAWGGRLVHGRLLCCSLPGCQRPPAPPQCRGQATCLTRPADGKIPPLLPMEMVTWG